MTALLIVIYIAFVSLGFPDSPFGVTWPVVYVEFGLPESFGSVCSEKTLGSGFQKCKTLFAKHFQLIKQKPPREFLGG